MDRKGIIKIDNLNEYLNEQNNKIGDIAHETLLQYNHNNARLNDITIENIIIKEFEKIDQTWFIIHNLLLGEKND